MRKEKRNSVDEKPLRATSGDFDRFIKSTIWYDMRETIKDRIEILQEELLMTKDHAEMRNIQGQMIAWKELLGLPGYLKQCAHQEANIEQKELNYE